MPQASDLNKRFDEGDRHIGHGVIVAYVATVVAITGLLFVEIVAAGIGIMIMLALFGLVFSGDMALQYLDMIGYGSDDDDPLTETPIAD